MIKVISLFFLLKISFCIAQNPSKSEIIDSFKTRFDSTGKYAYVTSYHQKFKSSIAEDTTNLDATFYLTWGSKGKYQFRLDFNENGKVIRSVIGCEGCKTNYEFFHTEKKYTFYKFTEIDGYVSLLNSFPVINKGLIDDLEKSNYKGFKDEQYKFSSSYLISIDKDFLGFQTTKTNFTKLGVEYNAETYRYEKINKELPINIFQTENLLNSYSRYVFDKNSVLSHKKVGEKVNDEMLAHLKRLDSSTKKIFLLDFFYQSCLPCIESIPELAKLQNDTSLKNVKIIGVDPVLRDTLNMEKFKKRYNINYTVLTGTIAEKIWGFVKNTSFPTMILVDSDGILRYFSTGVLKEKEIIKLRRKLLNTD